VSRRSSDDDKRSKSIRAPEQRAGTNANREIWFTGSLLI
jgi:hypothetical protein